jgi:hypothetical protein
MGPRNEVLVCVLCALVGCASARPNPPSVSTTVAPVAALGAASFPAEAKATRPVPPHPVIEAYIKSLESILSAPERDALRQIDLHGTNAGDTQRLRYLAADRAVRVFLPAALEASRHPVLRDYARRIRELPPLLNPDTDAVAHQLVSDALRARARIERGELVELPSTEPSAEPPASVESAQGKGPAAQASEPPPELAEEPVEADSAVGALRIEEDGASQEYAEAIAIYAETYAAVFGVSKLHADSAAAAAADAADAAVLLTEAIARGADRDSLVQEGLSLVQRMADAARRRERIPLPKKKVEPPPE